MYCVAGGAIVRSRCSGIREVRASSIRAADIVKFTANDLLEVRNFGQTTLREVREKLANHRLCLKGEYSCTQ